MLGGGVRFCQWSVAPLQLGFPGGFSDTEVTCRGIMFPSIFHSPMAIYSDVNGEARETCPGVKGRRIIAFFR
jgi:hypothetical protein